MSVLDKNQVRLSDLDYFRATIVEYYHWGTIKFFAVSCPKNDCQGIKSRHVENWIEHLKTHKGAKWNKAQLDLSNEERCLMFCGRRINGQEKDIRQWVMTQQVEQKHAFRCAIIEKEDPYKPGERQPHHATHHTRKEPKEPKDHSPATSGSPSEEWTGGYGKTILQITFGILVLGAVGHYTGCTQDDILCIIKTSCRTIFKTSPALMKDLVCCVWHTMFRKTNSNLENPNPTASNNANVTVPDIIMINTVTDLVNQYEPSRTTSFADHITSTFATATASSSIAPVTRNGTTASIPTPAVSQEKVAVFLNAIYDMKRKDQTSE
ncbi:hypothetical protein BGAL_0567g00010 [Botrytis galanthina]|uniref:Uncharacterized protein n=1 Tax=Botrytis galanthina TaxID=278940 RepID=A0A4S8QMR0_9HELO|nr:hypothetical protein BGAL_0567g00010 [Botrytis galanthina]